MKIPAGAGLGGGSADAAAVLVGMNELFDLGLDAEQLRTIGARIGADVPPASPAAPRWRRGGGDPDPLPAPPAHRLLIAQAREGRGYGWDLPRLRRARLGRNRLADQVVAALRSGNLQSSPGPSAMTSSR